MATGEQLKIAEKLRVMTDGELMDYYKVAMAYSIQLDPESPKWDKAHEILRFIREERKRRGITETAYAERVQPAVKPAPVPAAAPVATKKKKKKNVVGIVVLVVVLLLIGLTAVAFISGMVTMDDVKSFVGQVIPEKDETNQGKTNQDETVQDKPSADKDAKEEASAKLSIGDTASTDLAEFTLKDCEFAYYLSNVDTNFVEPTTDTDTMFAASLGTCYVSATFSVTNKDRGGSLSYGGSFLGEWNPQWEVTYGGETYQVNGYDLNSNVGSYPMDFAFSAVLNEVTGAVLEVNHSSNFLLSAGETITVRAFGVIEMEPENLTDGFDFTISVPKVDGGYEHFTYTVPAQN